MKFGGRGTGKNGDGTPPEPLGAKLFDHLLGSRSLIEKHAVLQAAPAGWGAVQIGQTAIREAIDPAMNSGQAASLPGFFQDRRLANRPYLGDQVQLTHPVYARFVVG